MLWFEQRALRLMYVLINPLRCLFWRLSGVPGRGTKCIVEHNGKFLLVRINYAHKNWTFPGGGVKGKESYMKGAERELWEETGIESHSLMPIGEYTTLQCGRDNIVKCFYIKADNSKVEIDNFEIGQANWFSPQDLPSDRAPSVDRVIAFYREYEKNGL